MGDRDIDRNKEVALKFIQSISTNDAAGIESCLAPGATTVSKGFSKITGVRTAQEMVGMIGALKALLPNGLGLSIQSVTASDDRVVIEAEGDTRTSAGTPYCNQYCFVITMADSKVKQVNEYFCGVLANEVIWPLVEPMLAQAPAT
jgi:ketosteroid isomerase-like protein